MRIKVREVCSEVCTDVQNYVAKWKRRRHLASGWRGKISKVRSKLSSKVLKVCPTSYEAGGEEELGVVQQHYVWRPL